MKIIAEFNSTEELINFVNTFGVKAIQNSEPKQGIGGQVSMGVAPKEVEKTEGPKKEEKNVEAPKVEAEVNQESTEVKDSVIVEEEPKITKEMIREKISAAMKTGKQKEVKDIVAKYGASKVPDLKEEDYAAVIKEVEALL